MAIAGVCLARLGNSWNVFRLVALATGTLLATLMGSQVLQDSETQRRKRVLTLCICTPPDLLEGSECKLTLVEKIVRRSRKVLIGFSSLLIGREALSNIDAKL